MLIDKQDNFYLIKYLSGPIGSNKDQLTTKNTI